MTRKAEIENLGVNRRDLLRGSAGFATLGVIGGGAVGGLSASKAVA